MCVQNVVKDRIKLCLKWSFKVGLDFCNTYQKTVGTKFNQVTYSNQIILVYPVTYCCSLYTNIVSNMIHASICYIFRFIYINTKLLFTKCCVRVGSIQITYANTPDRIKPI